MKAALSIFESVEHTHLDSVMMEMHLYAPKNPSLVQNGKN